MDKKLMELQISKRPEMEICDAVKMIYQAEYGGGHMIKDEINCYQRIENEGSSLSIEQLSEPLWEDLGDRYARLNLSILRELPYDTVGRMFYESSRVVSGNKDRFEQDISRLRELCEEGKTSFSAEALNQYMEQYRKKGYLPVSHSVAYTEKYHPAYRVVKKQYCTYLEAIIGVSRQLTNNGEVTVAIDGQSAAGKTELAGVLSIVYGGNVFHTEDFMKLSGAGINEKTEINEIFDADRLKIQVLDRLNSGREFSYDVFSTDEGRIVTSHDVKPKRVNIVEGLFCMLPKFRKYYEYRIYMGIDPLVQSKTILEKYGEFGLIDFQKRRAPIENRYLAKYMVSAECDLEYHNLYTTKPLE
jgi:uridine kinase